MEQPTGKIVDTILQEGVDFYVTVQKPNLLHKLKLLPLKRRFVIKPIYLGTLLRIAKTLGALKTNPQKISKNSTNIDFMGLGIDSIIQHKDKMVETIALAIVNQSKPPSKRLVRFLDNNLTSKEALQILSIIVKQMDIQSFLALTVSVGGLNLLTPDETRGGSSEASLNTSGSQERKSSGESPGPIS